MGGRGGNRSPSKSRALSLPNVCPNVLIQRYTYLVRWAWPYRSRTEHETSRFCALLLICLKRQGSNNCILVPSPVFVSIRAMMENVKRLRRKLSDAILLIAYHVKISGAERRTFDHKSSLGGLSKESFWSFLDITSCVLPSVESRAVKGV